MAQDTTVNAIYQYVLSFIDVDTTDIPSDLCNTWIYTGFDDLMGAAVNWPFYQVGENADGTPGSVNPGIPYSLTTEVGVQNYVLPTVSVQGVDATVNPHNIVAVQGPHWELLWGSIQELESTFVPAFIVSQEPERWSFWGETGITLWPIPNTDSLNINIRAYRDPIDWVGIGAGGMIDAPNDFFSTLCHYVLSMAWGQQTDLQQSSFWMDQYQAGKARLVKKYLKGPMVGNIVLNSGPTAYELPPRLRYPFDGAYSGGASN